MKKEIHNIDNYFREGIEDFEATPPPIVWEGIEASLPRRKRRILPFFWLFPTLLLGVGIGAFFFGSKAKQEKQTMVAKSNSTMQNPAAQVAENSKINSGKKIFLDESKNIIKNNGSFYFLNKKTNIIPRKVIFKENKDENATEKLNFNLEDAKKEEKSDILAEEMLSSRNVTALVALPLLNIQDVIFNRKISFKKAQNGDCYSFVKGNWNKSVEFYAGVEYSKPFFTTKGTEPSNYAKVRDTSEFYQLGGDAGIWINPVHRSGLGFRTGIHASRWVENLDIYNAFEERFQMNVTQVKNAQGQVIKNDTSFNLVRGRYVRKYYNHFTTLDIPLQVGFEFLKQKNTQYFAYIGAMFNLRFWAKGEIFDPKSKIVSFPADKTIFRTQTNLSVLGHIGIRRRIAEHWWLTGALQSNYNLGEITRKENTLSQRYLKVGLQLGLRYQF